MKFDWNTVKSGMAFTLKNSKKVFYYVGEDIFDENRQSIVVRYPETPIHFFAEKTEVQRSPENDINLADKIAKARGDNMTQQTHTLGTWKVNLNDDGFINPVVENECQYICILEGGSLKQQIANAYLIAAAPELLEALIEIDNVMQDIDGYKGRRGTWEVVQAAIAKARGE